MPGIVFLWVLLKICHQEVSANVWPIKREAYIEGDYILGGFFPIHKGDNELICGRLQAEGIVELESMLYAVERINANPKVLPGKKLGVLALDSCDSVPYVLEGAVNFAKGFIVKEDKEKDSNSSLFICEGGERPEYLSGRYEKVVAVVGGHSSWVSTQLADVMQIYKIPQVSYMSTNPALSDDNKYKYFFRTVAPLTHQFDPMIAVMRKFNWLYVSVIYSDSFYGNNGYKDFKKKAQIKKDNEDPICFSYEKRINVENSDNKTYDSVIRNLLTRKAKAVVVIGDAEMARNLMFAATRAKANRFVWIGSTAWVSRDYVTKGNEDVMEGAIGISHVIRPVTSFKEYWLSMNLTHRSIDPWYPEYVEEQRGCRVENFDDTPFNKNYLNCTGDVTLRDSKITRVTLRSTPAVLYVIDAVYAAAHALHDILQKCPDFPSNNCTDLRPYLLNVSFEDEIGNQFRFDEKGDGPPKYNIINFQKVNGTYDWITVGNFTNFTNDKPTLNLYKDKMIFKSSKTFPDSFCSQRCKETQTKVKLDPAGCCWQCKDCLIYQYVEEIETNFNKTDCEMKVVLLEYMSFSNPWAIACFAFSVFGMMMTLCVGGVFWKFRDTPIFTLSGRELSYILLIGIFLLFSLTFAIVAKPSVASCSIVRFFTGFCYTISYATIIAKTHHLSKLSEQRASNKKPKPVDTKSLMLLILGLVCVSGLINATWMIHSPPTTDYYRPRRLENILICKGSSTGGYLIGHVFPFFLMAFATVYAFQKRDLMEAFNESRYINYTNYTTFVLWLAFLPMFLLNKKIFLRVVVISLLLNVSALAQLVCLFLPKLYLAIRRPEKNVQENVMCYDVRESVAEN